MTVVESGPMAPVMFGVFGFVFWLVFILVFAVIFGVFIGIAIKGGKRFLKNQAAEVLSAEAKVIAKRVETGRRYISYYYAAFELDSGERMEFELSREEFGAILEGDRGTLTYKGTRLNKFSRNNINKG